jgi:hypothetical protein
MSLLQRKPLLVKMFKSNDQFFFKPMCERSKIFAAMSGDKNITHDNLILITELGYEFESFKDKLDI